MKYPVSCQLFQKVLTGCRPNNCLAHLNRYCARSDCSNCLLKADGVAVLDVQTPTWAETLIMGHDSLDTTMIYVRGTRQDLQQAVEAIAWA